MSEYYLIIPPHDTDWRMDSEHLRSASAERWPKAEPYPGTHTQNEVEWWLSSEAGNGYWFEAHLFPNGRSFFMRGPLEAIADLACWYRALAPTEQSLLLSEEGYHRAMLLPPGVTPAQVIDHFLHGPTTAQIDPLTLAPYPAKQEGTEVDERPEDANEDEDQSST